LAEGIVHVPTLENPRVVDHIIPHKGNQKLFWDPQNWQTLCKAHHDEKTRRETGFGGHKE